MSNDMKLIMESWRASVLQESSAMEIANQLAKQIEDEVKKNEKQKNEDFGATAIIATITIKAISAFLVKMAAASALSSAVAKFGAWVNKKYTGQESQLLNNLSQFFEEASKATATLFIPKALKKVGSFFISDQDKKDKFERWCDRVEGFFSLIILLYVTGGEIYEAVKEAGSVNVFADIFSKAGVETAEQKKAILDLLERTVDVGEATASATEAGEKATQMTPIDRHLFLASIRRNVTLYFPPWPF